MNEQIKYIADHYGFHNQCIKAVEELNELGVKLAKSAVKNSLRVDAIEEIADVEIMLEQIKYLSHISDKDINDIKEYKVQRQMFRIKNIEQMFRIGNEEKKN